MGTEAEWHYLLSTRREAGIFTRYYTGDRKAINAFVGTGLSYGYFEKWIFGVDDRRPAEVFRTTKVNAQMGIEYRSNRRVSLEAAVKVGRLMQTKWLQLSLQLTANVYLGK